MNIDYFSHQVQNSKEWQDWHWQFQHRLTRKEQIAQYLDLTEDELEGFAHSANHFSTSVTPYILSKMNPKDPTCPIRRQYIPSSMEQNVSSIELVDPCNEDACSPVPGIVHRYPDRVLFLATDMCAVYCRYCTRSRLVGHKSGIRFDKTIQNGIDYIKSNKNIRDVLISGGDPLLFSDQKLDFLLGALREIPHVEIVRIGTRMPIVIPQRITDKLCKVLKKYHPLYMSLHINHPLELTPEVKKAAELLSNSGIPLGSQSVLLKGINDSAEVMKALVQKLLTFRIRPYYLYQCDPVQGTGHLRASLSSGVKILRKLRGHTTGYAIPTYVVDAPGGGGKIPIEPSNVVSQRDGVIRLRNWAGKIFEYHEESKPLKTKFSMLTKN